MPYLFYYHLPGQIDGAELVRVPTLPSTKGGVRHSIDTADLDVPIYANLQEDLETELSKDIKELSPRLSKKNRQSLRNNLNVFSDLEKELSSAPASPTEKASPSSKPVPPAKPLVSPKPSNGPAGGKPPGHGGGGGRPSPPLKPGLGHTGERPVPVKRKNKPQPRTQPQSSDGKTDGSASPQPNPATRNIVADIERQLTANTSSPSRHTSVLQRRSGPVLDESSVSHIVPKDPVQRSISNSNPDKSKFTQAQNQLNVALVAGAGKPRDFISRDRGETNRRNSQKRPTTAPPQPPPPAAKPVVRPPRNEYEPVNVQPPKKDIINDDSDKSDQHRLPIQVTPVQKTNLRRFSDDESAKHNQSVTYAQSFRKKPPMTTAKSEEISGSDVDSRGPKALPRQPTVEYVYAQQPVPGRVEQMLKEKEANRALNTGKARTYAGAYSEIELKSPEGTEDNGDSGSAKFVIGKEPPPKPGRSKLPSEGKASSAYELVVAPDSISGKDSNEGDEVFSGPSGLDEGTYGQYNDVNYIGGKILII